MQNEAVKRDVGTRLQDVGETLRSSWLTPTDTMITDDIPTLLTHLSRVPRVRRNSK